jgi:hypothetical protein
MEPSVSNENASIVDGNQFAQALLECIYHLHHSNELLPTKQAPATTPSILKLLNDCHKAISEEV